MLTTLLIFLLALTTIALVTLSTVFIWREWLHKEKDLRQKINALSGQIDKLEKANAMRLPYKSFEELLNAMAALDKEIYERNFQTSLLENATGHIANAMAIGTKREKQNES